MEEILTGVERISDLRRLVTLFHCDRKSGEHYVS